MPKVVFAHGWGFDKTFWVDTIKRFNINGYYLLDFDIVGNRDVVNICQTEPLIGIGHSGVCLVVTESGEPICLISISDLIFRISDSRDIENMRRNLLRNKQAQMRFLIKRLVLINSLLNFEEQYL